MDFSEKKLLNLLAQSKKPVILVFFAEWCRPCVETLKNLRSQSMLTVPRIITIDIERHPELANAFHVINLPTLMLYVNGVRTKTHIGALYSSRETSLLFLDK